MPGLISGPFASSYKLKVGFNAAESRKSSAKVGTAVELHTLGATPEYLKGGFLNGI